MDNRVLYGVMTLLFNSVGVPCFMKGNVGTGIARIILYFVTLGIVGTINGIMGIVSGIKIFCMSDEEFAAQKANLGNGVIGM